MTEQENTFLARLGLQDKVHEFTYKGPKEAVTLLVHVYELDDNGEWSLVRDTGYSTEGTPAADKRLEGVLTIREREDHAFTISCTGADVQASLFTEPLIAEVAGTAAVGTVGSTQAAELNTEIPLCFVYYGEQIPTPSAELYFETERLAALSYVQAITIEFTDRGLSGQ